MNKTYGYIYKLTHEDGYFVIGSTNNFRVRMKNHKMNLSDGNSDFQKYVKEHGGWSKVKSEILKGFIINDDSQLFREEGKFIDEVYEDPMCLNMKRAGITPKSPIGKIYKLSIGKYFYYGRTRDDYHRFAAHKTASKTKNTLLYKTIREYGGWHNIATEIIKEFECDEKTLKETEDEIVRKHIDSEFCLNSMPASTTPERERELSNARVRKWVENNPEKAKEQNRIKSKRWRDNNPERYKEVQQKNNEKRKEKRALNKLISKIPENEIIKN
jgi:predicted GIY-YIG superfamily endonuclease